jgi:hypothetical protein
MNRNFIKKKGIKKSKKIEKNRKKIEKESGKK